MSWQDASSFWRQHERPWNSMLLQKSSGEHRTFDFFYRHYPGKRLVTAMRGRYLGPAALIGPHDRSGWWVLFGARAYSCATEHLRGVTPDEADRQGLDERRELEELLKAACEVHNEDLTSQPGRPPPVEIPTEPPREPEETVRNDLDIGMDAMNQLTLQKDQERQRHQLKSKCSQARGRDWERVLDSMPSVRLHSRRPLEVLDSKRLVWRSPSKMNQRKMLRTRQDWSVPPTCS